MRPYPCNSPQAAARLVALTLMADGDVSKMEMSRLDELGTHRQLGLTRAALHEVVHEFCVDLPEARRRSSGDACRIDPLTLAQLLAEVDDCSLCEKVLSLFLALAEADGEVTEGEGLVLAAAAVQWGMQRRMMEGFSA